MSSFVGKLVTSLPTFTRQTEKHLRPIIEHRLRLVDEYGSDYPEKPVCLLD